MRWRPLILAFSHQGRRNFLDTLLEFNGSYRLRVLGNSGVVYTTFENSCSFYGDPDRLPGPGLFTGGQIEGNVCWQIASTDADSLMMFLEPESSFLGGERAWFSLKE